MICMSKFDVPDCEFVAFSQRRFIGFRENLEFDKKRLILANKSQIKILSLK